MRMDKCNNECYTPYGMCPRVEWCEKTKTWRIVSDHCGGVISLSGQCNSIAGGSCVKIGMPYTWY